MLASSHSLFLGLWYGIALIVVLGVLTGEVGGERKCGNKVNACMLYRKENNKKNNFSLLPDEFNTDFKNILILITFIWVFPFPEYFSPFSNNSSEDNLEKHSPDILHTTHFSF